MCSVLKKCIGVPGATALVLALLLAAGPAPAQQMDLSAVMGSADAATPLVACSVGPYPLCGGDCPPAQGCVPGPGAPQCLCRLVTPPCSVCGPGPHFVDTCGPFPPIGPDLIADNGVVAGIDINMDCVRDLNLVLLPCPSPNDLLRVDKRQGPLDDSNQFPGTRPIDGHKDVIDTEIVSMCLTGSGVTLSAGTGGPASFPLSSSLGAIAEVPSNPALADSFFDVFFELQGVPGGPAYNKTPISVQSQITCLPPSANYHHPIGLCLPLYTRGICAGGPNAGAQCIRDINCPGGFCANQNHIGNLVSANHSVNQPVCKPNMPVCNGNCPPGDQCQPGAQGCNCAPVPCEAGSPPQCGGACPPGLICTGNTASDPCHCVPPPCEQGPWPQCGGPCPPGLICQPDPSGVDLCQCEPPPCDQTLPPQCGGFCPNGVACIPNAVGKCECDEGPPPCDVSAPACNGTCPNAGDVCIADPVGCHCGPPPCEQSPYPQCGGPCPPGLICAPDSTGLAACRCEPPPCDHTFPPSCGGTCPAGLACVPGVAGAPCSCQPVPCDQTFPPACNGNCPVGLTCIPDATGKCNCQPAPCDQTAPQCNGPCPPGQTCLGNAAGGCTCVPGPCTQSPAPQCGGTCPSGQVCANFGANCDCVPVPCPQGPYPQCNGPCPAPLICAPLAGATGCDCVQPPCGPTGPHQCGGACPPSTVCQPTPTDGCECAPIQCQQSPFPQCGGVCPVGKKCYAPATANSCLCCPSGIPTDVVTGVLFTSKQKIIWTPHPLPCGWWWNVYKLTASIMPDSDHNGVSDDYGAPYQCHAPDPTTLDGSSPQVGQVFFYQVTLASVDGEGPMGQASNGLPRANLTPCP